MVQTTNLKIDFLQQGFSGFKKLKISVTSNFGKRPVYGIWDTVKRLVSKQNIRTINHVKYKTNSERLHLEVLKYARRQIL